jgi:ABC-type multidrug transport system fused ATPase/permease subunit
MGFTALTLFNMLRYPLDAFPDMLKYLVRSRVSIRRVEAFLRTPDVKGITDACAETTFGESFPCSETKRFADHEFAPKMFPEYTLPAHQSGALYDSRSTRKDPSVSNGASKRILQRSDALVDVNAPATPASAGTVVLDGLTLAWSPTLRDTEDADEERSCGTPLQSMSQRACFCMSRTGVASATLSAASTQKSATTSTAGKVSQSMKYQALDAEVDEDCESGYYILPETTTSSASENAAYLEDRGQGSPRTTARKTTAVSDAATAVMPTRPQRVRTSSGVLLPTTGQTARTVVLENTTFTIPRGALAVVVGVTGSGKSSLLQAALLGEGLHVAGTAAVGGRISYASQSAWIQNATLRDNVLFGTPYDQERYDRVVYACALLSDFKLLAAGDMTEIGNDRAASAVRCVVTVWVTLMCDVIPCIVLFWSVGGSCRPDYAVYVRYCCNRIL